MSSGHEGQSGSRARLDEMLGFIKNGAVVLTVNRRLARYLINLHDNAMKEGGGVCWATPEVMPLGAWVFRLRDEHLNGTPLLSVVRAKALWEKVLSGDNPADGGPHEDLAYRAHALLNEYCVPLPASDMALSEEARSFKRWRAAYEREATRIGFADPSSVTSTVAAGLSGIIKKGALPKEVVLAGFNELTPSVKSLLDSLASCGVCVRFWPRGPDFPDGAPAGLAGLKGRLTVRRYANEAEEVIGAAQWARETVKPGMSAAFIVPELERYRSLIEKEFARELNPASVLPGGAQRNVFNISLGSPLFDEPLVGSALGILSVRQGKDETIRIIPALLSPFFSSGTDRLALSRVDMRLRQDNRAWAGLREIKDLAARLGAGDMLIGRFDAWLERLKNQGKKLTPSAWAFELSGLLKAVGWPGQVGLTSAEHQALVAWNSILEAFASLDDVVGPMPRGEAVSRISKLAREAIHQSETPECAIQVLGLLEASGQSFDRIWLMGCHGFALPPGLSPNPFIAPEVRRRYNLPHASHEREFRFALSVLSRIVENAPLIDVSYPAVVEERQMRLSPFFRDTGAAMDQPLVRGSRLVDAVQGQRSLEDMPGDLPIPPGEKELQTVTGGTDIIKDQSHCPFKAFATHRLHAESVPTTEFGLTPKQRGAILHNALRKFWDSVGDSERLRELSQNNTLGEFIKSVAESSFSGIALAPHLTPVIALEKERLCSLLKEWTAVELTRGRFKVKKVEFENEITIAGLTIRERPDRVDVLEDGKEAVIDYKGKTELGLNGWLTERPKDPQLIIYCLSGKFHAITFARLMPGDCAFVGLAVDKDILPDVGRYEQKKWKGEGNGPEDWAGLTALWRTAIEKIAAEFVGGVCEVLPNGDPPDMFSVCARCTLPSFCRVFEMDEGFREKE